MRPQIESSSLNRSKDGLRLNAVVTVGIDICNVVLDKCSLIPQVGRSLAANPNSSFKVESGSASIDVTFDSGGSPVTVSAGAKAIVHICMDNCGEAILIFQFAGLGSAASSFVVEGKTPAKNVSHGFPPQAQNDDVLPPKSALSTNANESVTDGSGEPWSDVPTRAHRALMRQTKALIAEMKFVRSGGGTQHRLFDGVYAGTLSNRRAYVFETEAELHLSDDSPATLVVGEHSYNAFIIAVEGFNVSVAVVGDLGRRIPSATLKAEPWKLNKRLTERLLSLTGDDRIAMKLLDEGPALASARPSLNIARGQEMARQRAASADVTVIWGPPGTGKTHTMAQIAMDAMAHDETVLMISQSNVSVDGMTLKLAELMTAAGHEARLQAGDVVRFGFARDPSLTDDERLTSYGIAVHRNNVARSRIEQIQSEMASIRAKGGSKSQKYVQLQDERRVLRRQINEAETSAARAARVLLTTIAKANVNPALDGLTFDLVMVDEVSMAYTAHCAFAASLARKRLVLVGDFRQLAPIAQCDDARGELELDVFSYLGIADNLGEIHSHPWLVMLDEQRRMHPGISAFPRVHVYKGLLRDHPEALSTRAPIAAARPFENEAAVLVDLSGTYCAAARNSDNSRFNILSSIASFLIANEAASTGQKVAVITPYAAQARLLRAICKDCREDGDDAIACSTVHQFQGSERDVVVFDPVESDPFAKPGWLLFKNDNNSVTRLVNVAVTRARGKLVAVANKLYWGRCAPETNMCRRLIEHLGEGHRLNEVVTKMEPKSPATGLAFYKDLNAGLDELLHDLDECTKTIKVSLPSSSIAFGSTEVLEALKKAQTKEVSIIAKCGSIAMPTGWDGIALPTISSDALFPLIIIDDRITWFGLPTPHGKIGNGNMTAVHQLAFRIAGKQTASLLHSFCDLDTRIDYGARVPVSASGRAAGTGRTRASLTTFVHQNKECPTCRTPMALKRTRKGSVVAACPSCRKIDLLTVDFIDWFLNSSGEACPQCGGSLEAALGPYGVYVRCGCGYRANLGTLG